MLSSWKYVLNFKQLQTEFGNGNGQAETNLIRNHLACAKIEVSWLRSANDHAAVEVKDNQKVFNKMVEAKAERKLALKRWVVDKILFEIQDILSAWKHAYLEMLYQQSCDLFIRWFHEYFDTIYESTKLLFILHENK